MQAVVEWNGIPVGTYAYDQLVAAGVISAADFCVLTFEDCRHYDAWLRVLIVFFETAGNPNL